MTGIRQITMALVLAFPTFASAEESTAKPVLSLELNAADTVGEACRLTFVLTNKLGAEITQFVTETVLFPDSGGVVLLTLFDFAKLPQERPRVRQFQVPDTFCERLGMVLVNGADTCRGEGLSPALCEAALSVSSRVKIKVEG